MLGRVLGVLEGILLGAIGLGGLAAPLCIALIGTKPSLLVAGICCRRRRCSSRGASPRSTARPWRPPIRRCYGASPCWRPPGAVLEFLATSAVPVSARAGEAIVSEGEVGDRFYVIASGEVEILGRTFGPGESFGEIALLRDVPRTATVTAVTDVELVSLDRDIFVPAVTGHGPAHATAEQIVAERLGSFSPLLG